MRTLFALPVLLLVFASGCGTPRPVTGSSDPAVSRPAPEMAEITLGEPFALERRASVTVDGQRLRFDAVYEDSRCPEGTQCVWEGRAIVGLTLMATNQIGEVRLEIPGFVDAEDAPQDAQRGSRSGYSITLLALDPYPGTSEAEAGENPVATLVIEQTGG